MAPMAAPESGRLAAGAWAAAGLSPSVCGPASALRETTMVSIIMMKPAISLDLMVFDTQMSSDVYQGSALSRLAKMLVILGTTAIIITVMSTVPMIIIKMG